MFKVFLCSFLTLMAAWPSFSYPYIIRIKNSQKQPLLIQEKNQTIFQVLPGKISEIVVTDKNTYRVRYLPGKVPVNVVAWSHDEPINSLVNECKTTLLKHTDNDLLVCDFTFEKKKRSLIGAHTYDLPIVVAKNTKYSTSDFLDTLKQFSGSSNLFFHHPDAAEKTSQGRKRSSTKAELNAGVVKLLPGLTKAIDYLETDVPKLSRKDTHQNLLVFGDQGSGDDKAKQVARDMFALCMLKGCHSAIVVGDNIYPMAPSITEPKWEQHFVNKFTTIYRPLWEEWKLPFYLTLGNHDIGVDALKETDWVYFEEHRGDRSAEHYLNKRVKRIQAEVEYSVRPENPSDETSASRMWNMPASFYAQLLKHNKVKSFVVSINSNYFPAEVGSKGESPKSLPQSKIQSDWLRHELASKDALNAHWRIVYGHHALYSIGRHGVNGHKLGVRADDLTDMLKLRESLLPILCEFNADFYFAGHDHHLQIDEITCPKEGPNPGHKIVQIISGAASKKDTENPWGDRIFGDDKAFTKAAVYPELRWANDLLSANIGVVKARRLLGFAHLSLSKDEASIQMFESTNEGPRLLSCFDFNKKALSAPSCKAEDRIDPVFLGAEDLPIIPKAP